MAAISVRPGPGRKEGFVPTAAYAVMFAGQSFPPTESRAAGVTLQGAFAEMGRPLFLLVWLCMWLTAATELGPGQWYANIFNDVMGGGTQAGIILLVWVNGIMYLVRQFFGTVPHRMSPTALAASGRAVKAGCGCASGSTPSVFTSCN